MKSFKTQIEIDDGPKLTLEVRPEGESYKLYRTNGIPYTGSLLPADQERIEFDLADLRKSESEEVTETIDAGGGFMVDFVEKKKTSTGAMSPKGKSNMERATLNNLLEKLGVADPARLETERAKKKAQTRLGNKGVSDELVWTEDEKDAIRELGFGWLPQVGGSGVAADAPVTAPAAPQANEKPKKGSKPTLKAEKPAKGKPAPVPPTPKGKPANKTTTKDKAKGSDRKPRERTGGAAIFVKAFPNKQITVLKDDLVKQIAAAGASEASARAYCVWAKRSNMGTKSGMNPWPFVLEEYKNKDGAKALRVSEFVK